MRSITYANIYSSGPDEHLSAAFEPALERLRQLRTPLACEHRIGSRSFFDGPMFERRDPTRPDVTISSASAATPAVIDQAIATARAAQMAWRARTPEDRVAVIRQLAQVVEDQRMELAALASFETGKTRADAVAEVDECIAIVELLCDQLLEGQGFVVPLRAPSKNAQALVTLRPYGVFGVIAPFNFPFAIPFAMALGAVLTGNTVVLKPSGLTPGCGDACANLFEQAGLPAGVINTIHGGSETGIALVEADLDGMVFTGSAEVGLAIAARFSKPPFTRPVIAEMGGKNAAIVTKGASDLRVAAQAVVRSAFGMSGQKCNACSRAVVTADVYDEFMGHLVEATESLRVGDPGDSTAFTGPVISDAATRRFEEAVSLARRDGVVRAGGGAAASDGHYVDCTVVDGLPPGHELTRRELFLPVLTVTKVATFDEALTEANAVPFGLSAGLISEDSVERERFLDEIEAGIVFVSNPGGATTGVWPGSQTMSGWKASGTSGKGGFGPWYLQQFAREQSRTIFNT